MLKVVRCGLSTECLAEMARRQQAVDDQPAPRTKKARAAWDSFRDCPADQEMREALGNLTDEDCVYCECQGNAVDHFVSIQMDPGQTFVWANLNWACAICNSNKSGLVDLAKLLNPMADEETAEYFVVDGLTGLMRPNPSLEPTLQDRAEYTILKLKLNGRRLPMKRRIFLRSLEYTISCFAANPDTKGELTLLDLVEHGEFLLAVRQAFVHPLPELAGFVASCVGHSPRLVEALGRRGWMPTEPGQVNGLEAGA